MTDTSHRGKNEDLSEDISSIIDITKLGSYKEDTFIKHNTDHFKTYSAKLPHFKRKKEKNLTNAFFRTLEMPVPGDKIELHSLHIYGGPSCGKTTLARAIGHHLKKFYGKKCQCLECNYLPNAMQDIDPEKSVIIINVDDPMGAVEGGGTQDARRSSSEDVDLARSTYNAIRHIYRKRVLIHRAEQTYGTPVPDRILEIIDKHHKDAAKLKQYLPSSIANVSGILLVMWGPQLPTIDQTFHQNKMYEIYKGLTAMDEKREKEIRNRIGYFWYNRLGEKEGEWRRNKNLDSKSWSIVRDMYTKEIGWLYAPPAPQNVFEPVSAGGKRFQERMKVDTEQMDIWARFIYENRNSLMPPYDPFDKKENRLRSITNFLKDTLKTNKDPRTFGEEELPSHQQIFLKKLMNKKVKELDDRIIKYHYQHIDERDLVEKIAQRLLNICEDESISPHMTKGRNIIKDLARRNITAHRQFIDKPKYFRRIYDHLIYLWHQVHPEDSGSSRRGGDSLSKPAFEKDEEMVEQATQEAAELDENAVEFNVTEEELIKSILDENEKYLDWAMTYVLGEGIGQYDVHTNRQIYLVSQDEEKREELGIPEAYTSIEAIKYRKKQFRGVMSFKLGGLFEDWLEQTLVDGYELPGILEDIDEVQHSDYNDKGKPDFVLKHDNDSFTVLSAKCYISPRSETLDKEEIAPELRYLNTLLQDGKEARLVVLYRNIKISHLLIARIYDHPSDVPPNLTFSPDEAGRHYFVKNK